MILRAFANPEDKRVWGFGRWNSRWMIFWGRNGGSRVTLKEKATLEECEKLAEGRLLKGYTETKDFSGVAPLLSSVLGD